MNNTHDYAELNSNNKYLKLPEIQNRTSPKSLLKKYSSVKKADRKCRTCSDKIKEAYATLNILGTKHYICSRICYKDYRRLAETENKEWEKIKNIIESRKDLFVRKKHE